MNDEKKVSFGKRNEIELSHYLIKKEQSSSKCNLIEYLYIPRPVSTNTKNLLTLRAEIRAEKPSF